MSRGFLLFKIIEGVVLPVFLLFLVGVGISGCGGAIQPIPPIPTVCTPPASFNVNIYRTTPTPAQIGIPQTGIGSVPNNLTQDQVLELLKQTAGQQTLSTTASGSSDFATLIHETKNWSDIQTIKLDDVSQAQIVVTFLSPQLIKAVYGNEMRVSGSVGVDAQTVLDEIAKRDELIFFVMVITTTNNNLGLTSHKLLIPIREMVMVNADDVNAPPLRDDHDLAMEINTSFEPVFGYLTYPLAMQHGVECSWILNPTYNKNIFIKVPRIDVDGISAGPYRWKIPYLPLFNSGLPTPVPVAIAFDPFQTTSSLTPPSPMKSLLVVNGMDENSFWQTYARFLWMQVLRRNY